MTNSQNTTTAGMGDHSLFQSFRFLIDSTSGNIFGNNTPIQFMEALLFTGYGCVAVTPDRLK